TQLDGNQTSPKLEAALKPLDALTMTVEQMERTFPPPAFVALLAEREGAVKREDRDRDPQAYRRQLLAFGKSKGFRPLRELAAQLVAWKLLRAVYSENQLHEVLADFWFNHFNVSLTDNQSRVFVLSYERDALRPHLTGSFRTLVGATARHPAMLTY